MKEKKGGINNVISATPSCLAKRQYTICPLGSLYFLRFLSILKLNRLYSQLSYL